MLHLHDTALGRPVALEPRDPGRVSMYVCGPTVYADPHIGHGRFALVFDVLRRYLEWTGLDVTYVSNITDLDDKIINRANDESRSSVDVAVEYEAVWYGALDRLGVRRPDHDPHATAYVEHMVDLVHDLVGREAAYVAADGVYFSTGSVPDYGLLARQSLESLRAGAGERAIVGEAKRSPLDFALWKLAKPGEPRWPSPWGDGRPGWHTECVVMALDLLGEGFDLHGGGQDLAFPHHENERAQAAAAGRPFSRRWAHNGFVELGGEKMSKSLGNVTSLTGLLDAADPRAYRLLVLRSHWRAPLEVTVGPDGTLAQAANTLGGLDDFARRVSDLPGGPVDPAILDSFRSRMDDDLDTPGALALLFDTVRDANRALDAGDSDQAAALAASVAEMGRAVGLDLVSAGAREVPAEVADLMARREAARSGRDWAAADAIRDELGKRGWIVEDTPQGPRPHRSR